ncbi:MAG TPA: hypothetical protein VE291_05480 [Terracidiphilus sp.]|jgi:hypothetical protein|nr:hypothetical protein [Terracidiphilus sp.]
MIVIHPKTRSGAKAQPFGETGGGTAEAVPCYKTSSIEPLSRCLIKMDNHLDLLVRSAFFGLLCGFLNSHIVKFF